MTYPTLYLIQLKCFSTRFHSLSFNSLSLCDPPKLCPKTRALISSSFALQFSALHSKSFRTVRLASNQHLIVCTPLTIPSPLSYSCDSRKSRRCCKLPSSDAAPHYIHQHKRCLHRLHALMKEISAPTFRVFETETPFSSLAIRASQGDAATFPCLMPHPRIISIVTSAAYNDHMH